MDETERRYDILDTKIFKYRGSVGRASLVYDRDTNTKECGGKQYPNGYRFYGNTLEEVKADFHGLVDGLIDLDMYSEGEND